MAANHSVQWLKFFANLPFRSLTFIQSELKNQARTGPLFKRFLSWGGLRVDVSILAGLTVLALGALRSVALAHPAGYESPTSARAAALVKVTDTAHLHMGREPGPDLLAAGAVSGTLPGSVKVRLNIGTTIEASFTITTPHGSISGHGSGKLHTSGEYASFGGTLTASGGSGRYAHAHGSGGLYGVINRRTYSLTIQTTGTLSY
jgi:hypothetical protein